MSIERIGEGVYRVLVRVRLQGRIVTKQSTITGTKEAAKNLLHKLKADLRAGSSLTVAKTFEEALDFYIDRHDIKPSKPYFDRLRAELGAVRIVELEERFDRWFLDLKKRKRMHTDRALTNATINRYLAWANAVLNFSVKHHMVIKNPLEHFGKLKETARDVSFSDDDERRLLGAIDTLAPYIGPAVRFMLQIPSRRAEVVNMKRVDVDLFNNIIRVKNGTTKNGEGISKIIPPDLVGYMRTIPVQSEYVFFRKEGGNKRRPKERYEPLGSFRKTWETCTKAAGLSGLHVHDLRHIAATRAIDAGTPAQVVMEQAGWKTDMLRTYYHRSATKARELFRFRGQCEGSCEGSKVEVQQKC